MPNRGGGVRGRGVLGRPGVSAGGTDQRSASEARSHRRRPRRSDADFATTRRTGATRPAERYNPRMAGNTFGKLFRVTTAGVSHGPGYLCIIDGCPAGLELSVEDLLPDLARRRPGQSKLTTQRDEADTPGNLVRRVRGQDRRHPDRPPLPQRRPAQRRLRRHQGQVPPRPRRLHLRRQVRLPRLPRRRPVSSARETVCRVAAGAVAKKLLAREGIRVSAMSSRSAT